MILTQGVSQSQMTPIVGGFFLQNKTRAPKIFA